MDSEEEWVETSDIKRDTWMQGSLGFLETSSKDHRKDKEEKWKARKQKASEPTYKPGQHSRELNPYWKEGGAGLPKDDVTNSSSGSAVGDGGLNWLRKAYKRVSEQAKEEGRSMESVAAERWGSLKKLEDMLAEAESKNRNLLRHEDSRSRGSRHRKEERFYKPPRDDSDRSFTRDRASSRDRPRWMKDSPSTDRPRWKKECHDPDRACDPEKARPVKEARNADEDRNPKEARNSDQAPKPNKGRDPKDEPSCSKMADEGNQSGWKASEAIGQKSNLSEPDEPKALTEKEMNELAAKILKAELMGNSKMAETLKQKMECARKMGVAEVMTSSGPREEVVLLTKSTRHGMSRPFSQQELASSSKNKRIKVATHDGDGQRLRYFHDDENFTVNEMFLNEKFTTSEDETALFLKMAAKAKGKTDSDYEIDDIYVDHAAKGGSNSRNPEQERSNAIKAHKRQTTEEENCSYCLDGKTQKHLIIATGIKAYLMVPRQESLTEGHCLIVSMEHISSATLLDEDVWSEIQLFRKGLTKMFEEQGKDTVFMETSLNSKYHRHMFLECVPVDQEIGFMAPMYFKKAILECDTEWAENKKLVDLSKKSIRHSVPKGFPYFSVDFGLQGGFAHVVEDNTKFPWYFGKEVVGGLLNAEPRLWLKEVRQNFAEQSKKVLQFEKWWGPYDWTHRLCDD